MDKPPQPRPLVWACRSRKDWGRLPTKVQDTFGYALYLAQVGEHANCAKPLKGFGSAGVVELVSQDKGNAYRAVYTVRFKDAVYVLHVFQKKSKRGIATPKEELDMIKERLKWAEEDHKKWSSRG